MAINFGRRQFITVLCGTAFAWPLATRAQQGERMRLVGSLEGAAADDTAAKARHAAFVQPERRAGDRARRRGLRALREWRSDPDSRPIVGAPS